MTDNDNRSSEDQQPLDEILAELMRAIDAGQAIDSRRWLVRYPEFAGELQEFFAQQDRVERLVGPLRHAAERALHVRCPHCHNPIELLDDAALAEISCPSCGSSFSLVGDGTLSHYQPGERTVGHFQLLDRVGVGQFGSVWKARDTKLDRTVAIKIPRNSQLDGSQAELFLRDARAAAQLKHPNIVSVHEVGKQDQTVYIVSDFVHGATLKEWLAAKRLTTREAAELCVKIAKALHHAHEAGVIHRDLKPGNIMVDTDGEPHIVDFGLAKREAGEITMTVEGQIIGTPAYMSPEQARGEGHIVDRRADIYSLGVILFELLTGELPFRGDKQMLIVQILNDEPPNLRKLNTRVPRDMDTICLKCLEKAPHRRYESAELLADELTRALHNTPIQARPITKVERAWRWYRKNPLVAMLSSVAAVMLLIIAGVATIAYVREADLRRTELALLGDLEEADAQLTRINTHLDERQVQLRLRQRDLSRTLIRLAAANVQAGEFQQANQVLDECPIDHRTWDWHRNKRLSNPQVKEFDGHHCVAFGPNGRLLATNGNENKVVLLEIASGQQWKSFDNNARAEALAFDPQGQYLASSSANLVMLWNVQTEQVQILRGHKGRVATLSFSSDGRRLLSVANEVIVWDIDSRTALRTFSGVRGAISPDGSLVATVRGAYLIEIWNLARESSEPQRRLGVADDPLNDDLGRIKHVTFSPDSQSLAIGCDAGAYEPIERWNDVLLWDLEADHVQRFSGPRSLAPFDVVSADLKSGASLAFHPGGSRLVSLRSAFLRDRPQSKEFSRSEIAIWDTDTGLQEAVFSWNAEAASAIAFSQDGKWMAVADEQRVSVWHGSPDLEAVRIKGYSGSVFAVAFSPDGRLIANAGRPDGEHKPRGIAISDIDTGQILFHLDLENATVYSLQFSPSGELIAAASNMGIQVWSVATRTEIMTHAGVAHSVAFSADGARIAFAIKETQTEASPGKASPCSIRVWDLVRQRELWRLPTGSSEFYGIAVVGNRIYASGGMSVSCWDLQAQERLFQHQTRGGAYRLAVSPDGERIAVGELGGNIEVISAKSGERLLNWSVPGGEYILDVAFSKDGRMLATAEAEAGGVPFPVRIWDSVTGLEVAKLRSKDGPGCCYSVDFCPDGQQIAAGWGFDSRHQDYLLLWDTRLGDNNVSFRWIPHVQENGNTD